MSIFDFLAHLQTLDIHVAADNGKLRINAPQGSVTPEIRSELSARKAEILSLLSEMEPILAEPHDGPRPLSLAQEHLWQLHRLTPETVAYNMYGVCRLSGALNVPALDSAIHAVVERHQILRTSFTGSNNGMPEQVIAPASSVVLRRITSSGLADELQSIIDQEIRTPFDLSSAPLFRPTLIEIEPNDHVLILAMHHIISDGHSFAVLYDDLERAYGAACQGLDVDWSPLPLQYADYAVWQRRWLETDASTSDRIFWQEQLAGDVPALELPFDHVRPLHTDAQGDYVELPIQLPWITAIQELCRREGVTLFTAVLAAAKILFHRQSGQQDLLIATPVAGRDRAEFNRLIGYFNNTLLLRTDLTGIKTMGELLQRTQATVMDALAHQMFPFKEVANFPNMIRTPLSRAMVAVHDSADNSLTLPGLDAIMLPAYNQAVQYDLAIELTVHSHTLVGRLMYRKALFERDTVTRLADEFMAILQEMSLNADGLIRQHVREVSTGRRPDPTPFAVPRTDLEHRLAQIWQEVLQVERVGIHDEFFDLGGHSLLALRLFTRIEQETGTNLPLFTLFQRTTVARLADLIEGKNSDTSWDVLVPIQSQGSKAPFFSVHGIGGGVLGYRDLVSYLGDDQPFLGLQAIGQDGRQAYDLSIEAMALRYIKAMRSYQPHGPYRIGGYCFGGVVAYEMACQLERMGEEVSLLAIFEGAMPNTPDTRFPVPYRLGAIWKHLPTWMSDYAGMSPRQLLSRFRSTLAKIRSRMQGDPDVQRRVRVEETLDIDINSLPRRNIELTDLHLNAALEYAPKEYHGVATVFRARNRSINEVMFGSLDPEMGWGRWARGGVNVHLVDGFHRNMHLSPYAESLAAELKKCLDGDIQE